MWALFLGIVLFLLYLYFKIVKVYNYWEEKGVPHAKPLHYIFGNFTENLFRIKSMQTIVEDGYINNPKNRYVGFYEFMKPVLLVRDPELIKDITVKDFDWFPNHRQFVPTTVDSLWGKNLLQMTTEEGWHSMRATLSPSFTASKMKMLFNLMEECAAQFVDYFKSYNGEVVVELKDTFTRFANDIIGTCAFGIRSNSLKHRDNEFYVMGKEATDFSGIKGFKFFGYEISPTLMKLFDIKIFNKKVRTFFKKIIKETVNLRREQNIIRPDMIHLLLEAAKKMKNFSEEEKKKNIINELSDEDITAQALIFFIAGFDTVSTAMCFLTYNLAINPDVQRRLYEEITETMKQSLKTTYESITSMKYLDCVISESLRLNSPVTILDRRCQKSYTIKSVNPIEKTVHLDPGTIVWIPVTALHQDEQYFPNPKKFDPERFNSENKSNINRFAYLPFGSRFALLEIKMIIVEILKHFEIIPNAETKIPLKPSVMNFNGLPKEGIWVSFKPKNELQ
ncbi:hypothetical protein FQA39_LY04153 [Lamprigera yunnana]|nr:hypothetical protein FQA39_LY04153 [Lamprigera yunnana]